MIRLFYNYYSDPHPERKKEIDLCFQKNLENPHLNTVIIESQSRLTYRDFFGRINKIVESEDISIICNSDIFFDESIKLVENMKSSEVYALSRWEMGTDGGVNFCNRPDSQDVWIIKGPVREVYGDFHLGRAGCDNRIAYEFRKAGYHVYNPSLSIKTYHVHNTGIRTYTRADTVPGPYLTLAPESLK